MRTLKPAQMKKAVAPAVARDGTSTWPSNTQKHACEYNLSLSAWKIADSDLIKMCFTVHFCPYDSCFLPVLISRVSDFGKVAYYLLL